MEQYGAGEILLTSMDRDGTKTGYDLELTRDISDQVRIPVIASGGVGNLEHIYDGLTQGNASAALAASIFHYQEYSIAKCKNYLHSRGIPVRLSALGLPDRFGGAPLFWAEQAPRRSKLDRLH
jgi:cyclase